MDKEQIVENFPIKSPYKYMEKIISVSEEEIVGSYTFKENEYFYEGHFPEDPVTPGAILQESAAQVGLLAFGMYLLDKKNQLFPETKFFLGASNLKFLGIVRPGEQIIITSKLIRFRFDTIKCKILITSNSDVIVCKGEMIGYVRINKSE